MKAVIIFGSPRKNGNTAAILKSFMDELKSHGITLDYYDVYEKNIMGCKACLECQKNISTICCVLDDDMQPILKSISEAELIVFASPIYIWSVSAPVKTVMDRSIYASCKYYADDPHGPALLKGKRIAVLTTCGYPIEKGSDLLEEQMKRYCKHCGSTYVGMLTERQRNLKEPFMDKQKELRARQFAKSLICLK